MRTPARALASPSTAHRAREFFLGRHASSRASTTADDDDDADRRARGGPATRARRGRSFLCSLASSSTPRAGDGNGSENAVTFDALAPEDYAFRALRRRFDDLDRARTGRVTTDDLRAALTRLGVPCTERSIEEFMSRAVDRCGVDHGGGETEDGLTFAEFGDFALRRERELLKTFRTFDHDRVGYLTTKQLKRVLMREGYAASDGDVEAMMTRIKAGEGAFSKGKGLFNAANEKFVTHSRAIDFAEFRDFLLLSDAMDTTQALSVW